MIIKNNLKKTLKTNLAMVKKLQNLLLRLHLLGLQNADTDRFAFLPTLI